MDSDLVRDEERFDLWFKQPIVSLMDNKDAGFALLMLSFPILERYLRRKLNITEDNLCSHFYDQLVWVFPGLDSPFNARQFWKAYRHGLMHQATVQAPEGKFVFVHNDVNVAYVSDDGKEFWVSPKHLAARVLQIIEDDLPTFESSGKQPLATVIDHPPASGVSR